MFPTSKPPRPRCGWAKLHWCIRTMAYVPFENAHMPGPPKQIRQMISNDHGSSRHFPERLVNQRLYYRVMSLILRHPPCKAHLWCMPGHSATHARGHCRIKRLRDHIQPNKKNAFAYRSLRNLTQQVASIVSNQATMADVSFWKRKQEGCHSSGIQPWGRNRHQSQSL